MELLEITIDVVQITLSAILVVLVYKKMKEYKK